MGEKGKRQVETARKIGKQREASNGLGRGKGLVRLLPDLLRSPISFTFSPTSKLGPRLTEKNLDANTPLSQIKSFSLIYGNYKALK